MMNENENSTHSVTRLGELVNDRRFRNRRTIGYKRASYDGKEGFVERCIGEEMSFLVFPIRYHAPNPRNFAERYNVQLGTPVGLFLIGDIMASEFEIVDIWVGRFADEERHAQYFEEHYDEENEDAPLNQFCEDMGETFCDHDFLGGAVTDENSDDLNALMWDCPWSDSYASPAVTAYEAKQKEIGEINAVVLVFGKEISNPKDAHRPGVDLFYLGRFPCDPSGKEYPDEDDEEGDE